MLNKIKNIAIVAAASVISFPLVAIFANEPCIAQFVAVVYAVLLIIVCKKTSIGKRFLKKFEQSVDELLPGIGIQRA